MNAPRETAGAQRLTAAGGLGAAVLPARRAARLLPEVAIRQE